MLQYTACPRGRLSLNSRPEPLDPPEFRLCSYLPVLWTLPGRNFPIRPPGNNWCIIIPLKTGDLKHICFKCCMAHSLIVTWQKPGLAAKTGMLKEVSDEELDALGGFSVVRIYFGYRMHSDVGEGQWQQVRVHEFRQFGQVRTCRLRFTLRHLRLWPQHRDLWGRSGNSAAPGWLNLKSLDFPPTLLILLRRFL